MNQHSPIKDTVAEALAHWIVNLNVSRVSPKSREIARMLVVDVAGLAVAARGEEYVTSCVGAAEPGLATAIGHEGGFDSFSAALINGTAAHGEDYDDTFEGGPVHSGAVIVPAVLAACQREGLGGEALLKGIVVGVELLCRLSLVAPKAIHKAGFHPTAVIGTVAAAAAVSAALGLDEKRTVSAIGIAGSMAAGIIEYLAEGTWTKRMHAGNAAQSGIRAALLARGGFLGPRSVFEGTHGFFQAFAPSRAPDFSPVLDTLGQEWVMETIAFKPYACGTMTQPFIDCAIQLAERGIAASDIETIVCQVGEGTVHRLWEPLASKHAPQTTYAAKFSTPICMALGFIDRKAGLAQFTEERIFDPAVRELASKISYVIDPNDEYPTNFTGQLKAHLKDGSDIEIRQPHMRGGKHAPLTIAEIEEKFTDNAIYGGWKRETAEAFLALSHTIFESKDVDGFKEYAL
ncbi:MmgE/PrpD family protein [Neorhizobium sp. P12A]|uniref:MmgE/PrpD family protein n=1 Tax=Neorhizobium sp. P12A TaxID=2268027 RepID=UPI0011EC3B74|nr:MmgE/PrpD family protein [Neorhizobium sp. P12A]KAA0697258.1 MmgE/PrpD family protein [Neorhizobium sp. P12A]